MISASAQAGIALASWSFETSGPSLILDNSMTSPNAMAEGGVFGGTASGFHANAATDWSSPAGNGSVESFSSNTWTTGDYYQFCTSSDGYKNINIQWDQTRSSTGPDDFVISWSTDGVNFTDLTSYVVLENNAANGGPWSSTTGSANFSFGPEFGPSDMDDQATIYFRLTCQETTAAAGTNRVDNVVISGELIPAPGALALLGVAGLAARRRRVR
jgi:hypothetical protein